VKVGILKLLAAILFLTLFFQNCTGSGVFSSLGGDSISTKDSGNGTGYGGKIEISYYRYIQDYRCEGKYTAAASISHNIDGSMTFNSCGQESVTLNPEQIVTSPFENQFIIYDDFLYSRYDIKPDGIPANLAELQCRDNFLEPKFELVAHYDRNLATAKLDFYGGLTSELGLTANYNPSRVYSNQSIIYNTESFSITVDLGKTGASSKQFLGEITTKNTSTKLICVTGAGLDASAWPIKKEIPDQIAYAEILPQTLGKILVTTTAKDLVLYDQDKKAQSLIDLLKLSNPLATGVYNAQHIINPSKDEMVIIDRYDRANLKFHYYFVNLIAPQKIEIPLPYFPNIGTTGYQIMGFYKDSIFFLGFDGNNQSPTNTLYEFNTQSRQLQKIAEVKNWRRLIFLKNPNRIVFTTSDGVTPMFYVLQLDGLILKSYSAASFGISTRSFDLSSMSFFSNGNANELLYTNFEYQYLNNTNIVNSQVLKLKLDSKTSEVLARDVALYWQKPDSSLFVLCDITWNSMGGVICKDKFHQLLDSSKGQVTDLAYSIFGVGLGADNQQVLAITDDAVGNIYSMSKDSTGKTFIIQISSEQKNTIPVCRNLSDTILKLLEGQDGNSYLFTKDQVAQSFRMYRVNLGECHLLNQFPLQNNRIINIKATSKGFGVSIETYDNSKITSFSQFRIDNQMFFMPIDGQAPILLNPMSKGVVTLDLISPSQDGKLIYLRGTSEVDKKNYLYSFKIP
jgi:hypothetical protein